MTADLLSLMGDTGQQPQKLSSDEPAAAAAKTEHVELELVLHYDNDVKASILVSVDGHESKAASLNKSDIQYRDTLRTAPAWTTQGKQLVDGLPVYAVNIPESLAKEKGLI